MGFMLDEVVVWQLGKLHEARANQELERVAGFDSSIRSEDVFIRSQERITKIALGGEYKQDRRGNSSQGVALHVARLSSVVVLFGAVNAAPQVALLSLLCGCGLFRSQAVNSPVTATEQGMDPSALAPDTKASVHRS